MRLKGGSVSVLAAIIELTFDNVKQALQLLEQAVGQLEPHRLGGATSVQMLECFCRLEKLASAGKALCALQVADCNAWWDTGHRSPAHLLAQISGTTVGRACEVIQTAELMQKLPQAGAAYRAGRLSERQAAEIATAAELSPNAEQELVWAAERQALQELRRRCAEVRARARSESERQQYLHRRRELKHWVDYEGAFRLSGRLTPDSGAVILACLEPFRQKATIRGRNKDKPGAYLADALVAMAEHSRKIPEDALRPGPGAVVHVRVDYEALKRGYAKRGEVCEVPGVAPIPVAAVRDFASDAFIKAVVMKGRDVSTVAHLGRNISTHLETAVIERDPTCVVPGCGETQDLQIDHSVPVHHRGPTKLRNLGRLCRWHHYQKTHHGYVLRRFGGGWVWESPHGPPRDDDGKLQPELEEPS